MGLERRQSGALLRNVCLALVLVAGVAYAKVSLDRQLRLASTPVVTRSRMAPAMSRLRPSHGKLSVSAKARGSQDVDRRKAMVGIASTLIAGTAGRLARADVDASDLDLNIGSAADIYNKATSVTKAKKEESKKAPKTVKKAKSSSSSS
ncbi:hypothetical protein AAMO2058_001139000, partial [Amorphochlora amoebiformis]